MKENRHLLLCIFVLSASILAGSFWIGYSINKAADLAFGQQFSGENNKGLMTAEETAEYLSLPLGKFKSLVLASETRRSKLTSYQTYRFVPFVEIDGTKYYNKTQIDRWIEHNILQDIKTSVR